MIGRLLRWLVVVLIIGSMGGYLYLQMHHEGPDYYYGEVQMDSYDVYATVSGLIKEVLVEAGQEINGETQVMILDDEGARLRLAQSAVAKEAAQVSLDKANSPSNEESIRIQELTIQRIISEKDSLRQTIAAVDKTYSAALVQIRTLAEVRGYNQLQYEDQLALFEAGLATEQVLEAMALKVTESNNAYEQAVLESESLLVEKRSLQHRLTSLTLQIQAGEEQLIRMNRGADKIDLDAAELGIDAADANMALLAEQLDKYTIRSGNSGIIEEVLYDLGEFVSAGAPVVTLKDPTYLETFIYVSEKDLMQLSVGQNLQFHVVVAPEISVEGTITAIAGEAMFTPMNIVTSDDREKLVYKVTVALRPQDSLRSGMLLATELPGRE